MKKLYSILLLLAVCIGHAQNPADVDPTFNFAAIPANSYYIDGSGISKVQINSQGKMIMLHSDDNYFDATNTRIKKLVVLNNNLLEFNLSDRLNGDVQDFFVQPDDKIIIVGKFTTCDGISKNKIVRLNADYSIDTSFNVGTGFNGYLLEVHLLSNGNVLVYGIGVSNYNGTPVSRFTFLSDTGGLVRSFSPIASIFNFNFKAVQNDGKIIGVQNSSSLIRLNIDGTLDAGFSTGTANNTIEKAFLQSDGNLIVTGTFTTYNSIAKRSILKVSSNGTIDNSFVGHTGTNDLNIMDLKFQPDNKMVVYGGFNQYSSVNCKRIIRLNSDGTRDAGFALQNDFSDVLNSISRKLLVQSDGKLLVYGNQTSMYNNTYFNGLIRFNVDGSKDNTLNFISKGIDRNVSTIIQQPDGKIVVSGSIMTYNGITKKGIIRLNTDGTIDNSFDATHGIGLWYFNYNYVVKRLNDGKYLCYEENGLSSIVKVVSANGTDISSTNPSSPNSFNTFVRTAEVQGNDIYLTGNFTTFNGVSCGPIVKMSSTLTSLNATFNCPQNIGITNIVQMHVDSTGKVYALGQTSNGYRIIRLNANGSFDRIIYDISTTLIHLTNFALQPDGKILIFSSENNNYVLTKKLIRIDDTGLLDSSFNAFAVSDNNFLNNHDKLCLKLLPDGKILISFDYKYNNRENSKLFRLNANGTLDTTFDSTNVYNDLIKCVEVMNNGGILVGGYFRTIGNYQAGAIVKLKGENYYFVQGENRLDADANGCDAGDFIFSNVKYNVASSTSVNSTVIANTTGNYTIGLTSGSYTITPTFENPAYFTASPSSITVDFPSQNSPLAQNFCITSNGVHPDLEVSLVPITPAQPGFDAKYKLVYKNKGNQVQSGSVALTFDDTVLDIVTTVPVVSSQAANSLSWNFAGLNPYETREIILTLNLNSPTETPALNSGSLLNYTAAITSAQTDETPSDNTFMLNQTVVNSYDPNDKTCLQGTTVGPDKVGEYVHYVIRFENTGTYNAQNITVTDFIDNNKFDVATLIPVSGSHLFTTKISQGNKVEFVFENINLPFADATNDGYVAFKIKTKSTLVSGDTFSNGANIYFDYNYPITTNTYTTTIQALSVQDFSFGSYLSLYPNPVAETLNISKKSDIEIQSLEIYNSLGQIVLAIPNAKELNAIDVSNLTSGIYFVKINSDKGSANTKFIKK